jgi:transcriptional regulator GlxA family with amidase domain
MDLATLTMGDINTAWDCMCALVHRRTGQKIIGQIDIDYIVVNGNKRKFH